MFSKFRKTTYLLAGGQPDEAVASTPKQIWPEFALGLKKK